MEHSIECGVMNYIRIIFRMRSTPTNYSSAVSIFLDHRALGQKVCLFPFHLELL